MAGMKLIGIDHLGVNLPWFDPGPHPRILRLRETVKAQCLYHRYPTGEPWDFILPGAPEDSLRKVAAMADRTVCLRVPPDFFGVGQFYRDFTQTEDREVINILRESKGGINNDQDNG